MSSPSTTHRVATAAALAVGALALSAVVAVSFGGGFATTAQAAPSPEPPTLLGVDVNTAVAVGPEVAIGDKFDSAVVTTAPVTASLIAPAIKVAARVPAKPAPRPQVAKHFTSRSQFKRGWRSARVSWYGPGLYGNGMAGGGKLRRNSMVVAHRSLPFGTRIMFKYKGRTVIAVVRDRGPFISGRKFDLGPGTAKALHFSGVGKVKYRILR